MTAALAALSLAALAAAGPGVPAGDGKVLVLERTMAVYGLPADPGRPGPADPPKPAVVKLRERTAVVRLAADRLREQWSEDELATVVRFDLGLIWVLNPGDKTYRETSFRDIEKQTAEARERLARRLPLIEDRALQDRLRRLLGGRGQAPEVSVEQLGDVRTIAGESCRALTVKLDGEELFRGWISDREVPLADRRWLTLGGCFAPGVAEKLAAVRGLLMEATFPMPDGGRLELVTRSIREARAEPGEFDDPRELGYKQEAARRGSESGRSGKPDRPEKPDRPRPPADSGKQP